MSELSFGTSLDVDHYNVQYVAVHRYCDWSGAGLLSGDTADQLIRWQRGD